MRFVIAAAGADRTRPARLAVGLVRDVMRVEKLLLLLPRHAVANGAETVIVRPCEAMAQRDAAVGRNAHQSKPGAARVRFGMTVMDLLQRFANVRKPVMPVCQRRFEIIGSKRAELIEQVIEAAIRNRVIASWRRGYRGEAHFPESKLVRQMLIDPLDVERLPRQRDARTDRP